MIKNIFNILNSENKIWVDIFKNKYGNWTVWNKNDVTQTFWFYKSICSTIEVSKSNFKIISCNPFQTDIWKDPCIVDLPIALKPTFLNKDISLDNLNIDDILYQVNFHFNSLNIYWERISKIINDPTSQNTWIWTSFSLKASTASVVYDYLNKNTDNPWKAWHQIWNLCVISHIKVLFGNLFMGRLQIVLIFMISILGCI